MERKDYILENFEIIFNHARCVEQVLPGEKLFRYIFNHARCVELVKNSSLHLKYSVFYFQITKTFNFSLFYKSQIEKEQLYHQKNGRVAPSPKLYPEFSSEGKFFSVLMIST